MRATGRWAICLVLLLLPGCGGNGGVEPGPVAITIVLSPAPGVAYCWGNNEHGQLGNGSNTNSNAPVPMSQ